MKDRARGLLLALIAFAASAPSADDVSGQVIEGVLLEQGADRPIDLAVVTLMSPAGDSVMSVLTDDEGRFSVEAERAGDYLLAAAAWGFTTTVAGSVFTLDEGGRISVEFRVPREPFELAGLTVEADAVGQHRLERNGFVERARMGFGKFITPAQIEDSHAYSTSDLLARTGRIMTEYRPEGERITMRGSLGHCTPFVYLDGYRISLGDLSLDAFVPLEILDAVEVYRSAVEAPPQYAMGVWRCGVILLWSKAR